MLYHSVPYLVGLASIAQRTNGYFLPVTENNIDEIRKRQNPDYDATRAVAQISWFDTPDCQPELGRQIYRFDVPGLDQAPVNPDQCDPGLPEYNIGNEFFSLSDNPDYRLRSYYVIRPLGECIPERGQLDSVILYPNCKRKPVTEGGGDGPPIAVGQACIGCSDVESWSSNDGDGVCINTPLTAEAAGPGAYAITQRVTNC